MEASEWGTVGRSKRVVIAGGSGFVGLGLADYLTRQNYEVVILSRTPGSYDRFRDSKIRFVEWDGKSVGDWQRELAGASALVNLAGRSINCVKSDENLKAIIDSRVNATRALGESLKQIDAPPPVWIQVTTAHIVGDNSQRWFDEFSPIGEGMAPTVGKAWEETFFESILPEQRPVVLRSSLVLGRDRGAGNGALGPLTWLTKLGLGGRVGEGKHGMSWIHETDMHRLIERGIRDSSMHGIYIASAPSPVPQREFMKEMRKTLHQPIGLPATKWMASLGAHYIFRTNPDLVVNGWYVHSTRLKEEGFVFEFPTLGPALKNILDKG